MPFHRLIAPSYFGGLPGGYDYINDPASNGDPGAPSPSDGKKGPAAPPGDQNEGTYFVAFKESAQAINVNRPAKALAENTDLLDDYLHRDLAVPVILDFPAVGAPTTSLTLPGVVYVGRAGTPVNSVTRSSIIRLRDTSNSPLIFTVVSVWTAATVSEIEATLGGGSVVGNVWQTNPVVSFLDPIPAGTAFRVIYFVRSSVAQQPLDLSVPDSLGVGYIEEVSLVGTLNLSTQLNALSPIAVKNNQANTFAAPHTQTFNGPIVANAAFTVAVGNTATFDGPSVFNTATFNGDIIANAAFTFAIGNTATFNGPAVFNTGVSFNSPILTSIIAQGEVRARDLLRIADTVGRSGSTPMMKYDWTTTNYTTHNQISEYDQFPGAPVSENFKYRVYRRNLGGRTMHILNGLWNGAAFARDDIGQNQAAIIFGAQYAGVFYKSGNGGVLGPTDGPHVSMTVDLPATKIDMEWFNFGKLSLYPIGVGPSIGAYIDMRDPTRNNEPTVAANHFTRQAKLVTKDINPSLWKADELEHGSGDEWNFLPGAVGSGTAGYWEADGTIGPLGVRLIIPISIPKGSRLISFRVAMKTFVNLPIVSDRAAVRVYRGATPGGSGFSSYDVTQLGAIDIATNVIIGQELVVPAINYTVPDDGSSRILYALLEASLETFQPDQAYWAQVTYEENDLTSNET